EILRGHLRPGDQTVEGSPPISHDMIATLTGPGFEIKPTTPEKQTVAEGYATVWEWEIEAKREGGQELEATLYALLPDDGSATARQRIDSYTQTITVTVKPQTWGEWLKSAEEAAGAIKAILLSLGAIAGAVLSWFGISRRRQRGRVRAIPRA